MIGRVTEDSVILGGVLLAGSRFFLEAAKKRLLIILKVFQEQIDTKDLYRVIPCYYGWLLVKIEADGPVFPCCRCYKPLGNTYEKAFHEIWYGEGYRRFREEALQINSCKSRISSCDCHSCPHHTANLRVYKLLHPIKGRLSHIERLCPTVSGVTE